MITINQYIADLVRLHNTLMLNGMGEIPVISVYEFGGGGWLHGGVSDNVTPKLIHSTQVKTQIQQPTAFVDMPDWFKDYDGMVVLVG